jgi:hypothetical protein
MSEERRGWLPDPFGLHEQRYFSLNGKPTRLVRNGGRTSHDEPPSLAIVPPRSIGVMPVSPLSTRVESVPPSPAGEFTSIAPVLPASRHGFVLEPIELDGGNDCPRGDLTQRVRIGEAEDCAEPPAGVDVIASSISNEFGTPNATLGESQLLRPAEGLRSLSARMKASMTHTGQLRRSQWGNRWIFAVPWMAFSFFTLWQGTTGPVLTWQDSLNYESIGSLPLWSGGFWFGGRPPLTPFLWKVTGSPGAFLIGQSVISIVAWGFLAWTVGELFPVGWRRILGFLTVLAFASTTPIELWNRSVLSESLALSGLAVLFAVAIRFAEHPSSRRASAFVAVAFWCALARDTEIVLPLILGVLLGVFVITHRHHDRIKILIATACALFLIAGFCIATVVESGRETLNTKDNLYVRVFPYPSIVAWFASHGMPEKAKIDRLAQSTPPPKPGTAKTVFPDLNTPSFARLNTWVSEHGASTYSLWLLSHPLDVLLDPLRSPDRTYNDADGNLYYYAAQNRVTSGLTPVLWPPWIWLLGLSAVTVVVVNEREIRFDRVAQILIVLGLIGIPAMLAAWSGDGQEVTRHTVEGLAQVRLGVLLTLLYVVLVAKPSRPQAMDGTTTSPGIARPFGSLRIRGAGRRTAATSAPSRSTLITRLFRFSSPPARKSSVTDVRS